VEEVEGTQQGEGSECEIAEFPGETGLTTEFEGCEEAECAAGGEHKKAPSETDSKGVGLKEGLVPAEEENHGADDGRGGNENCDRFHEGEDGTESRSVGNR
jgi:hypothetical protein